MTAYEINWDDYFLPLYGNPIYIPTNTIMWRGYDTQFEAISDRPAYYGSREFAEGYAKKDGRKLAPFITSRPLRLIDIRFMKELLRQLFEYNQHKTKENIRTICATSISFGICSLSHQITLFKQLYAGIYQSSNPVYDPLKQGVQQLESIVQRNDLYEQPGYRIAETSNDAFVMGFLKELFDGQYDGYIAPNIVTPFHVEKKNFLLNSEVVLFDPISSGIKMLSSVPPNLQKITINSCILQNDHQYTTIETRNMKMSYYTKKTKSGGSIKEVCEDYNYLYDTGNKHIIKQYKQGCEMGKKWKQKPIHIRSSIAPGPTVDPRIFDNLHFYHL
jgi:hypothetical protein